jgi:hypothetical protein
VGRRARDGHWQVETGIIVRIDGCVPIDRRLRHVAARKVETVCPSAVTSRLA